MVTTSTEIREPGLSTLQSVNSSQRLVAFLEKANLHKKDFAEMIGVTLSYVYSLIDETIPFSTRTTTLERVAVVMETEPESFPEYKRPEEPRLMDQGIEFLKNIQREQGLSNVQFLKRFPRSQRLGGDRLPRDRRRALLCAGDHGGIHVAGLSRR